MNLKLESIGTGILVRRFGVSTMTGLGVTGGVGRAVGGAVINSGFLVGGFVTGTTLGVTRGATGINGGTTTVGGSGWINGTVGIFGGKIPSPGLMKTSTGGTGRTIGAILMSDPLQPSGKKYRMFPLLCSSSLKLPTNEAFLKRFIDQ